MPQLISLRVRAVEGRRLADPFTIGRNATRFLEGEQDVQETTDHYYRKAILAGDCEYIATIATDGSKTKESRDPELVLATMKNKKAREAEKAALAKHEAEMADAEAFALKAADLGLSPDEYRAQLDAEKSAKASAPSAS